MAVSLTGIHVQYRHRQSGLELAYVYPLRGGPCVAKLSGSDKDDIRQKVADLRRDPAFQQTVDEATGYQEFRSKTELQQLLSAYLSEELLPWSQRFPIAYFREMFRLWNWPWPPQSGIQGPRYAGKLTKQIIYDQLPKAVVDKLEIRNPPDENWQRRDRNH